MKKARSAAKKSMRKGAAKKMSIRPTAMKRDTTGRSSGRPIDRAPVGFIQSGRLFVPAQITEPVPANKLRAGMKEVKRQIDETLSDLIESLTGNYGIKEVKLVASFSADGRFLGFGVGGAASIEITICPTDD